MKSVKYNYIIQNNYNKNFDNHNNRIEEIDEE